MSTVHVYGSPMQSEIVSKYFLDRNGVQTERLANFPGKGHFDLAKEIVGAPDDLYSKMSTMGYVRVAETDKAIFVDAPRSLSRRQRDWLSDRSIEAQKELIVNNQAFVESKDPRAKAVIDNLAS